ncbi:hypothetical protein PN36_31030 [Candidatus Thiomargarita nelsonii]|uniref:Uncharacterized protein n=1 Tax=Candidatus Thiomargarita nelsonii TaxID=1003181 RepID=A0A4E0QRW8_9GAMM|nr:hypothetical protein PN36_31030 [Candidatus Thiomargarita nelsonii]
MARLNIEIVQQAIADIIQDNEYPSNERIIERLGYGSKSTLTKLRAKYPNRESRINRRFFKSPEYNACPTTNKTFKPKMLNNCMINSLSVINCTIYHKNTPSLIFTSFWDLSLMKEWPKFLYNPLSIGASPVHISMPYRATKKFHIVKICENGINLTKWYKVLALSTLSTFIKWMRFLFMN